MEIPSKYLRVPEVGKDDLKNMADNYRPTRNPADRVTWRYSLIHRLEGVGGARPTWYTVRGGHLPEGADVETSPPDGTLALVSDGGA